MHHFLSPVLQGFYLLAALLFSHESYVQSCNVGHWALSALLIYAAMWLAQVLFNAAYIRSRHLGNILTEHRLEARPDGLFEETALTQTLVRWPGLWKVRTCPGFVAIYITSLQAHVVPDRAFASVEAREALIQRLQTEIRNAKT